MLSFWEKEYLLSYDYIVVGGGITGLSAACSLKEKNRNVSVLVVERGLLPTGASTKNAGFACIGSLTEKLADLRLIGEAPFLQLIEDRWKGLQMLRTRLGDQRIGYEGNGGYELILENHSVNEDELALMNKLLNPIIGHAVFSSRPELIRSFGFAPDRVKQLIFNDCEGQINTGMMMRSLWEYASTLGVQIMTGAQVHEFNDTGNKATISCKDALNGVIRFTAGKLIICTNAFTKDLLPEEEITPGRGQVLITAPIEGLKFKGIFHFNEGYYYFRNLGDRVIFGGGRNMDFETETTTDLSLNNSIQESLDHYLREVILPGTAFEITDRWSGIMAFGKNKLPLVKKISDHVLLGARLNGMGIALGSMIGEELSLMASA